jgi:hypothetical protein
VAVGAVRESTDSDEDPSHAERAAGSSILNTRLDRFESQVPFARFRLCRISEKGDKMSALKIVAILLIAAGTIGLVYGGITYTKTTHDTNIGPLKVSVTDKETVNIPVWAGVGAIVVGGALLLVPRKG